MTELVVTKQQRFISHTLAAVECWHDDGVMVEVESGRTYPMEMGEAVKPQVHY